MDIFLIYLNVLYCLSFKQVIFSKYTDLLPKEVLHDDAPELQRPDGEAVKEVGYPQKYLRSKSRRTANTAIIFVKHFHSKELLEVQHA